MNVPESYYYDWQNNMQSAAFGDQVWHWQMKTLFMIYAEVALFAVEFREDEKATKSFKKYNCIIYQFSCLST